MGCLTLRWHLYIEQGEVSYSSLYFCAPQEKNSDKTDIGEETFEVISVLSKVINSLEFLRFCSFKKVCCPKGIHTLKKWEFIHFIISPCVSC
jgi:hypothetical protein